MHYKLLAEYREVLGRDEQLLATGLSPGRAQRLLAALVMIAQEVTVRFLMRPHLPDEDDNFIYELAFAASPCTIVTHNVRDFAAGLRWPGVLVKSPARVLKEVPDNA